MFQTGISQAKHFFIEICRYVYGHSGLIHFWMSMLDNKIKAEEYEYTIRISRINKVILCPVHLPGQKDFCLGQNQICLPQNNFAQDKIFFVQDKNFVHGMKRVSQKQK